MSHSDVLAHIELPPATGVDYHSVEETSDPQIWDEPMTSTGLSESHKSVLSLSKSNKKPIMDGEGHVCTKASVNPFFNLLRLYRSLPDAKGKTAPQVAVEGARIWRAMSQAEKNPFQQAAVRESKRRLNSREKRSKSTNDTKSRDRRPYNRRSKEIKKVSGRNTKVY